MGKIPTPTRKRSTRSDTERDPSQLVPMHPRSNVPIGTRAQNKATYTEPYLPAQQLPKSPSPVNQECASSDPPSPTDIYSSELSLTPTESVSSLADIYSSELSLTSTESSPSPPQDISFSRNDLHLAVRTNKRPFESILSLDVGSSKDFDKTYFSESDKDSYEPITGPVSSVCKRPRTDKSCTESEKNDHASVELTQQQPQISLDLKQKISARVIQKAWARFKQNKAANVLQNFFNKLMCEKVYLQTMFREAIVRRDPRVIGTVKRKGRKKTVRDINDMNVPELRTKHNSMDNANCLVPTTVVNAGVRYPGVCTDETIRALNADPHLEPSDGHFRTVRFNPEIITIVPNVRTERPVYPLNLRSILKESSITPSHFDPSKLEPLQIQRFRKGRPQREASHKGPYTG